jgi:hypothetical protein
VRPDAFERPFVRRSGGAVGAGVGAGETEGDGCATSCARKEDIVAEGGGSILTVGIGRCCVIMSSSELKVPLEECGFVTLLSIGSSVEM